MLHLELVITTISVRLRPFYPTVIVHQPANLSIQALFNSSYHNNDKINCLISLLQSNAFPKLT